MKKYLILTILLVVATKPVICQTTNDTVIEKNVEIFRSYLQKLNTDYLYKLNYTKLVHNGIDAMNKSLDPFTVFSDEEEVLARRNAWRGYLFSGIGAQVTVRDSLVTILGFYKNSPAQKAGIRIGDRIIQVDSTQTEGLSLTNVIGLLKGDEGTNVVVKVDRPGVGDVDIPVVRGKIISPSVNYYGMINDTVGYIKCSKFLENSYDSMRTALLSLKKNEKFSCLILDMRDNLGGLAQDAVNTANLFLPQGKLICSLKSENDSNSNYNYYALYEPVDTSIKIVALSSAGSASATELMLGAFQDYDRAVIIGQRTYGKGLVQGTRQLVNNTELYLTAAKYYTPSGRCIQELDYSHQYLDGQVSKINEMKVYYTSHQRPVNSSNGIEPDIKTDLPEPLPETVQILSDNNLISDYATFYRNTHNSYPEIGSFSLSKEDMDKFMKDAKKEISKYDTPEELALGTIETSLKKNGSEKSCKGEISRMKKKLMKAKRSELLKNREVIKSLLEKEILVRYYSYEGRMQYSFSHDAEIKKALEIFKDGYEDILNPVK
jgi:carboxyl-terminal processing protease